MTHIVKATKINPSQVDGLNIFDMILKTAVITIVPKICLVKILQKKPELICEHEALFGAIRNGTPFNTLKTCADSCFVAIAGRESCYAGKRLKLAWVLEKSQQNMVPDNLKLTGKKPVEEVPVCGSLQKNSFLYFLMQHFWLLEYLWLLFF